jgi:transposase
MHHKESAWEFRRRRAVELMGQGEAWAVIAHVLGVSIQSLYNWDRKTKSGVGLSVKPLSGRRSKLSSSQLEALRKLLLQGAKAHGWSNDLWTGKRVAKVIKDHFGVDFSINYVQALLRNSLNWTVQRPVLHVSEPSKGATKQWLAVELPRIVSEAQRTNSYIVFIDEAGFMLAPLIRQTFAPRGKTPVIQVSDPHSRISVAGALTVNPNRTHLGFLYYLLPDNVNFHGDSMANFVEQILLQIPGPVTILWDGISIHTSEPVRQCLERSHRVVAEPFPVCAPELNPVDKVWFYLKYDCLPD